MPRRARDDGELPRRLRVENGMSGSLADEIDCASSNMAVSWTLRALYGEAPRPWIDLSTASAVGLSSARWPPVTCRLPDASALRRLIEIAGGVDPARGHGRAGSGTDANEHLPSSSAAEARCGALP
jgi:hypothetical protein